MLLQLAAVGALPLPSEPADVAKICRLSARAQDGRKMSTVVVATTADFGAVPYSTNAGSDAEVGYLLARMGTHELEATCLRAARAQKVLKDITHAALTHSHEQSAVTGWANQSVSASHCPYLLAHTLIAETAGALPCDD